MKTIVKKMLSVCLLTGILFAAAGCNTNNSGTESSPSPSSSSGSSEKIAVVGSTSVTPLMEKLQKAYKASGSNAKVEIQGVGSSAGIKAAIEGSADIGMSSRELKEEEKAQLQETVIAMDGIAVIVNPANPVKNLTIEQISAIYKGEIKNWKEVGGNDKPIIVVSREDGSGTRTAFEELVELQEKQDDKTLSLLASDAIIADSNGAVKSNIATKENTIGYMSLGSVDDSVHAIKVNDVEATAENVKNSSYKIARPFIVVTKGAPTGETDKFIQFMLSDEGQKIVSDGYITVK